MIQKVIILCHEMFELTSIVNKQFYDQVTYEYIPIIRIDSFSISINNNRFQVWDTSWKKKKKLTH